MSEQGDRTYNFIRHQAERTRKIMDLEDENAELRTRVADLEADLKKWKDAFSWTLHPRVAADALNICDRMLKESEKKVQDQNDFKRMFTDVVIESLDKENKELQNRLSTVEEENERLVHQKWSNQDKYDDLLKASEGMEKALERIVEIPDQTDYEEDPCGQVDAMHEKATKALADFRAVKEKPLNAKKEDKKCNQHGIG